METIPDPSARPPAGAVGPGSTAPLHPPRSGRRYGVLAIGIVTALTLAYFYPLFLGRTNSILGPYGSFVYPWASLPTDYGLAGTQTDYAELSYPWLVVTKDALDEGTIPLWSPNAYGGGYDLFANGSSAVLYPPRLLALLAVSPVRTHDLFLVLHLWGSGVAMYLLARELSIGRAAGTFAAVAWMFCTWNTGWMQLEVVTPMALFLPATVAVVHRAVTRRSARSAVGAGVVCALAATSGHLLFLGLTLFIAGSYGVALAIGAWWTAQRAARRDRAVGAARHDHAVGAARRRSDAVASAADADGVVTAGARHLRRSPGLELASGVGRLALLGLVAAGIAAVVLVPTALAVRAGQRVPFTYAELTRDFIAHPSAVLRLIWPNAVPLQPDDMHELGFAGWATAAFAAVGVVFGGRRAGAWFARTLVTVVPLVMIGTPLTWLAWRLVPGMNVFRPYARLIVFATFGLVIAAAIGVQVVLDLIDRHRQRWTWPWDRIAHAALAVVVLATAGHLAWLARRSNPPFVPHEARYTLPPTPLVVDVHSRGNANGWPSRTMPVLLRRADDSQFSGLTLYANTPQVVGLDTTSGYDSSLPRRTLTMARILNGADPASPELDRTPGAFVAGYESWSARFGLLARLGITHIVTVPQDPTVAINWNPSWAELGAQEVYRGPDGIVYQVPGATAGPHLVAAHEVVTSEADALARFIDPTFDASSSVVIERDQLARIGVGAPAVGGCPETGGPGEVVRAVRGVNTASIEVAARCSSWLVVPDAWADGWTATVDGRDAPILRVNYHQRAVRLEAAAGGTSTIEMRYRPPGFVAGAAISVLSTVAVAAALVWLTVRGRRSARRSARRRLQLEQQLVAEQAGVERHAGPVDAGEDLAPGTRAAAPVRRDPGTDRGGNAGVV